MPNGTIGRRCCAHTLTIAATSSVDAGKTTKSGSPGACHDSPWLWCSRTESDVETRSPRIPRSASSTESYIAKWRRPIGDCCRFSIGDFAIRSNDRTLFAIPIRESLDSHQSLIRNSALDMFTSKTLSFLRSLKRNNKREWFHERARSIRAALPPADDRHRRAARRRFPFVCARDARRSEGVACCGSFGTRGSAKTRRR